MNSQTLNPNPSQNPQNQNQNQPPENGLLRVFIRDDQGYAWTYENGRIATVLDLACGVKQAGYACANLEEGIAILNKTGHITGNTEILDPLDV